MIDDQQILKMCDEHFETPWNLNDTGAILKFARAMYYKGADDESELHVDENY